MTSMFTHLKTGWNHSIVRAARTEFKQYIQAIHASLNEDLFDADTEFWSHHVGGILLLVAADLILHSIFAPSFLSKFYTMTTITWGVGFFFAGLILRRHYINANWETQRHAMVLVKVIASCVFFSFLIVLTMSIISMTFYFEDYYQFRHKQTDGISSLRVIVDFFLLNWFTTSFYLLFWVTLYISITSRRKTKKIEIDNLRLQNSLKEAELNSLSNQLNPHFLFNALNNIRFMIHEDANNAEKMLMSLSSVLRYSLDSSKNEKVPLKEELEISHRYIELIKIQFEERLNFKIEIPEKLSTCQLPPMVLQMLLENAVKHGIENIREGGIINVSGSLDAQTLVIKVCNDLPKNYNDNTKEPGIGLFNIGQRLDLLYQEQGSVKTEIVENRFCVTVKIPQE